MATAAQINANQENSTLSTGPRTETGKKRASFNAFRHGLTSQVIVLPSEDIDLYHNFTASYHTDLQPKGVIEIQLVQTLADIQWRLNRARAHEATIFAMGENQPVEPDAHQTHQAFREAKVCLDHTAALNSLSLHEHRWQKLYFTSLKQLTDIQAARRLQEKKEMENAIIVYKQCKVEEVPFIPENFGFVLTEWDVETYLWRINSIRKAENLIRNNPKASKIVI